MGKINQLEIGQTVFDLEDASSVKFDAVQDLTASQQATVRSNIGVAPVDTTLSVQGSAAESVATKAAIEEAAMRNFTQVPLEYVLAPDDARWSVIENAYIRSYANSGSGNIQSSSGNTTLYIQALSNGTMYVEWTTSKKVMIRISDVEPSAGQSYASLPGYKALYDSATEDHLVPTQSTPLQVTAGQYIAIYQQNSNYTVHFVYANVIELKSTISLTSQMKAEVQQEIQQSVPAVDDTLTEEGVPADAKATGDGIAAVVSVIGNTSMGTTATTVTGAVAEHTGQLSTLASSVSAETTRATAAEALRVNKPVTNPNGTLGQLLRTLGDGTTEWSDFASPTSEQIGQAVEDWLDAHPEATTTVEDWSLTYAKLEKGTLGFVMPEMYGAVGDGETDDTDAIEAAIGTGKPVLFTKGKTYIFTKMVLPCGTILYGNGATLKRPNLKEAPYKPSGETDEEETQRIKWSRMFILNTEDTNDLVTKVYDLTIDGNAFSMWLPSDGYKYEQSPFFAVVGTEAHSQRLFVKGCTFLNNYSSGLSISNYCDVVIEDTKAYNCFKGIFTFVGHGTNVIAQNIECFNDYPWHTINVETNGTDFETRAQSNLTIINARVNNLIKFGQMTGRGATRVYGLIAKDLVGHHSCGMAVGAGCTAYFEHSCFEFNVEEDGDCPIRLYMIDSDITFNNCQFVDVGETNHAGMYIRCVDSTTGSAVFSRCTFRNMNKAVSYEGNAYTWCGNSILFDKCVFKDIHTAILSPNGAAGFTCNAVTYSDCVFDIDATAYIYHNQQSIKSGAHRQPVVSFLRNLFLKDNAGMLIYGKNSDIFNFDESIWLGGTAITYSQSSRKPIIIGTRYRLLDEAPTGLAFNDHDVAIVRSGETTTYYEYKNDEWVMKE